MSKTRTVFICQSCGYESLRWEGQCRECKSWNTFIEEVIAPVSPLSASAKKKSSTIKLKSISEIDHTSFKRIPTNIVELDRALSGGLVAGQVILLGGTPGIGKSTILLQLAEEFKGKVLYATGEESESQVALRAKRLGVTSENIGIVSSNDIDAVLAGAKHDLLIIDSIQSVYTNDMSSKIGTVGQVRECAARIISVAKNKNMPAVIVGHITKEGEIAGPKVLEHMVDTVLYMEGDKSHLFRLIRVQKNRFGDDSEVGIFKMNSAGIHSVKDPSSMLLGSAHQHGSGTAIAMILEGSCPLAVEIQALTTKTSFGYPKRATSGFSLSRLHLLCAVIQKRLGLNLLDQDVYANVASGLQVREPAADLAVCAAIISSYKDRVFKKGTIFFGEVGLSGIVMNVVGEERRIKESRNLGFNPVKLENLAQIKKFLV